MSVTFRMVGIEYETVYPDEEDPEYSEEVPKEGWYEVNLSNMNAYALLAVLERPKNETHAGYGCWFEADMRDILSKLKDPSKLSQFESKDESHGRFYVFGRSISYSERRFEQFTEMLTAALEKKVEVVFS